MASFHNPKRQRNIFDPQSKKPFKLSRSKIELFLRCPCCFYLDRRAGISPPSSPPFLLNTAVDNLLKKEFDVYRIKREPHPLMEKYGVEGIPFQHKQLDVWRKNFKGIQYFHKKTNLVLTGAVDDLWINSSGDLIVVDYKSTSKNGTIDLNDKWKITYKRQMEIYQWLFRKNHFSVSNTGYFVYCNAPTAGKLHFAGRLKFDIHIIPYEGNDSWVEQAVADCRNCLVVNQPPESALDCELCGYRKAISLVDVK